MLVLSPKKISLVLLSGAIFLALMNVVSDVYQQFAGTELRFTQIFRFDNKVNVPTWYSASLFLLIALLLWAIAWSSHASGERYSRHWGGLSLLFVLLSLDEVAAVHLRLDFITRYMLHLGSLRYGLLLLLAGLIGAVLWFYRKLFAQLPTQTQWQCAIAGGFYIAAIAIDKIDKFVFKSSALGYAHPQSFGMSNLISTFFGSIVDETCELIGIVIFIYALLSYISLSMKELHIRIANH